MIFLVRHGQTEQNRLLKIQGQKDYPLNENGILQAKLTADYIYNNYKIDVLISSPLTRAIQTCNEIKEKINYQSDIIIDDYFIERHFGDAEGNDISDEVFDLIEKEEVNGLESVKEIQNRVYLGMIDIFKKYKDKNVLITTHSHTIKAILTYLDKNRTFRDKLDNCSINIFKMEDDKILIIESNIKPF